MSIIGIPIGLYGYLFPGNINLMVVELYKVKKYTFLFSVLALILVFETMYCLGSLLLLNAFKQNADLFKIIEFVSLIMATAMGLWMIIENKGDVKISQRNTIYRGLLSVIIHPQQIPFWVIMGVVVNKFVPFIADQTALYQFAFFNAVGTLIAMLLYIIFGPRVLNSFKLNISQLNKVMGSIYILVSVYGFLWR